MRERAAVDDGLWVLEFHVGYWNSLGWQDPFSAQAWDDRQLRYANWRKTDSLYTPEAVVDGREAFVGSDAEHLAAARKRSLGAGKKALELTLSGGDVLIAGEGLGRGELWVAVTESELSTHVDRGENRGRLLKHAPVVRSFISLGDVDGGQLSRKTALALDPRWKRENLRVIAAVQDVGTGAILALGQASVK